MFGTTQRNCTRTSQINIKAMTCRFFLNQVCHQSSCMKWFKGIKVFSDFHMPLFLPVPIPISLTIYPNLWGIPKRHWLRSLIISVVYRFWQLNQISKSKFCKRLVLLSFQHRQTTSKCWNNNITIWWIVDICEYILGGIHMKK